MQALRIVAAVLSAGRIALGLAYFVAPASAGRGWIGKLARVPHVQVMTRGLGARDVALGAGALQALVRGDLAAARPWLAGQAISDGSDLVSTLSARRLLPRKGVRAAVGLAGGSAAIALAGAAGLRQPKGNSD